MIANITAIHSGNEVENHNDVPGTDLASLLHFGDKITIHEVHDEEQLNGFKRRYPTEWDEKVTEETA
ncbi:hypothetical protein SAMN05421858_5077 [Haladaptatus litoreus]|uniref:Uncharacterized protein n=1 Tax=Haladaptatus litoreus TaxID=553468 RepID=A0A1N7FHT7_9EURY|nr:hypothetical protein [Haladaptatus litoreus]SIR99909.1 hypothetical protein SAMN05421858_5077 [Haladaptatus litoreus]